jgi:hypothetical protein
MLAQGNGETTSASVGALFAAGDRVELLCDRNGLKRGMVGTVTRRQTLRGGRNVSPDRSGTQVFVVYDSVIGMIPTPVRELQKANS